MSWGKAIKTIVASVLAVWGIPGMIEDWEKWKLWFEHWQWWNFLMVGGGTLWALYETRTLWGRLFSRESKAESGDQKVQSRWREAVTELRDFYSDFFWTLLLIVPALLGAAVLLFAVAAILSLIRRLIPW